MTAVIKLWKCQTVLGCLGPKGPPSIGIGLKKLQENGCRQPFYYLIQILKCSIYCLQEAEGLPASTFLWLFKKNYIFTIETLQTSPKIVIFIIEVFSLFLSILA